MARAMRIEFPGAVDPITSRGNERREIFRDDDDRRHFLELLGEVVRRFAWIITGYTMLDNHDHRVLETPGPALSRGMQWLNGSDAAWFNRRHKRWGHLFGEVEDWRANDREYVDEKLTSEERLFDKVQRPIYLGTEEWVASMRTLVESKLRSDAHPRAQRTVGRPKMATIVEAVAGAFRTPARGIRESRGGAARMLAAWMGWYEGRHRLRSIAAALRLRSSGRVSDLVATADGALRGDSELRGMLEAARAGLG